MVKKKNLIILFLVSFSTITLYAQPEKTRSFLEQLIEQESNETDDVTISIEEDEATIDIAEEGDPWSVSFKILDHADFNNDSIKDYLISRTSSGMLGGNVKSNSQIIYYIMSDDDQINKEYEILTYAPFSYNIGDSIGYDKDKKLLTINFTQNFRTYYKEDGDLQETIKHFKYIDHNVYELSYIRDCELGKMTNKNIFKDDLQNVKRSLSIDMHNYTEQSNEFFENDTLKIDAGISGCDNFELDFIVQIKNDGSQNYTKNLISHPIFNNRVYEALSFLYESTRYKSLLKKVIDSYNQEAAKKQTNIRDGIAIGDDWTYRLSPSSENTANQIQFRLRITQIKNNFQNENWDITTRRKF